MPKIYRKISVYGDSICISQQGSQPRAQRIAQQIGWNAGHSDYAVGGQTMKDTLIGRRSHDGGSLFAGKTFAQHLATVDDSDIVLICLGGNDAPFFRGTWTPILSNSDFDQYQGAEHLENAANIRMLYQQVQAAGKRPIVTGMPYMNVDKAVASIPGLTKSMAEGFLAGVMGTQVSHRVATAFASIPFISTYGGTPDEVATQPAASAASVHDGLHPAFAYANAVNDWLATRIKMIYPT